MNAPRETTTWLSTFGAVALLATVSGTTACSSAWSGRMAAHGSHDWDRSHPTQLCAEDSVRAQRAPLPEGAPAELAATCETGDARACSVLGVMYEVGRGAPMDRARAATLFGWACEQGNLRGCVNLGRLELLEGTTNEALVATTRRFDAICQQGSAEACYWLGLVKRASATEPAERAVAELLFTRSCAAGYSDACFELGLLHDHIDSVASRDVTTVVAHCPGGRCGE